MIFNRKWFFRNVFRSVLISGFALSAFSAWSAQPAEFRLQIIDEETRRPIPCRVSIRNEKGVARKAEGMPFLYDHFVMPGEVLLEMPVGTYPMTIERGLEYLPRTGHFVLNKYAKDAKTETLRRFTNLAEKGWWSGDLMVMRNLNEIKLLMMADDLHFVPLAESATHQHFAAVKRTEEKKRAEEREKAGRKTTETGKKTDDVWFDSDRLFTMQNYILRHPSCSVGILNLPTVVQFRKLNLEARKSPISMLYAIRKKYPEAWFDVQDADCWDLPLLVALGLVDSFQTLGPHILRDQILPENVNWRKIPTLKNTGKISIPRVMLKEEELGKIRPGEEELDEEIVAEFLADTFLRPSQSTLIPDAAPMNYEGPRGRQQWTEEVYFHLLNTGHRIPPSAGSGSGLSPNAVGTNRMYVFVDPEEYAQDADKSGFQYEGGNAGFNRKMWWDALREGRVVVTNGPLMMPWVEGYVPGEVFQFPGNDGEAEKLNPSMTLMMQQKAQYIDFIVNGRVTQSVPFRNYAESGRLPLLEIPSSGWFLIRVVADNPATYCSVMSAPYYVEMGGKQKIQKKSAQFFVNWERKRIETLEKRGSFTGSDGKKLRQLHEYALEYWEGILARSEE